MWLKTPSGLLALSLFLVACGGGNNDDTVDTIGPGADTALLAVEQLVEDLNEPDFTAAAGLAVPNQAALASLAEAATSGEVAEALRTGDPSVPANFWSGFAQGSGSFLAGDVTAEQTETITQDGIDFDGVMVIPEAEDRRQLYVRESNGYRVDIFASFGAGLAARMIQPVERLLGTDSEDSRLILAELTGIVPSLLVAANQPDLPPDAIQEILQLVELITRVG